MYVGATTILICNNSEGQNVFELCHVAELLSYFADHSNLLFSDIPPPHWQLHVHVHALLVVVRVFLFSLLTCDSSCIFFHRTNSEEINIPVLFIINASPSLITGILGW